MSVGIAGNMSNYPGGFPGGLSVQNVPLVLTNPGSVFWVDSSGVSNSRGTYTKPFATLTAALAQCEAGRGDIILVKPGHAETISAAGGITVSKSGVAIIGLGKGALRPTLTLGTATTATLLMSGANATISNFIMSANFADIVAMIDVTATDVHIDRVEFVEAGADLNWVDCIDASGADNTADGLTVTGCRAFGIDAAMDSFIEITGDISRLTVQDNVVNFDNASALAMIEQATGKDMINVMITGNNYNNISADVSGGHLISNDTTANSGFVGYNGGSHADTAGDIGVDATGVGMAENFFSGVITLQGYLNPAADA